MRDAFKVLIFVSIIIFSSFAYLHFASVPVLAQEPNLCCLGESGSCYGVSSAPECTGQTFNNMCSELTAPGLPCEEGCCCFVVNSQTFSGNPSSLFACSNFLFLSNPLNQNCQALCTQQFIKVSGLISYNNGVPASSVTVRFTNPSNTNENETVSSNSQGYYEIYVKKNSEYSILLTPPNNPGCVLNDNIQTFDADITRNFALNCLPPGSGQNICYDCYEYTFSNPTQQCGTVTVTQVHDCPGGTCYPPLYTNGQTVVCAPGGGGCGECEPGQTMECPTGYIGQQICLQSCYWNQDNCVECPATAEQCTNLNQCGCPICSGAAICSSGLQCTNEATLEITNVNRISSPKKGLEVYWEINDPCESSDVEYYNLSGCEGNSAGTGCSGSGQFGSLYLIHEQLLNNVISYKHTELNPNYKGYFCYEVTAQMDTFNYNMNNKKSQIECQTMESNPCDDWDEGNRICVENKVMRCTSGNPQLVEDCNLANKICGGEPNALCVSSDICSFCNGPFGFFGYLKNSISIIGTPYQEEFRNSQVEPENCNDIVESLRVCYDDDYSVVNSAIGQLKACSTVTSCYDYRTEDGCVANPCGNQNAELCVWAPISSDGSNNKELGIGVCRPPELEDQDCSKCDEGSILGACTKQICELYGTMPPELGGAPSCFFNENKNKINNLEFVTNKGTCIGYLDVSCETYDTKIQCLGSNQQEFNVNIIYDSQNQGRKSGDNSIINPSTDLYNKGRCVWDNTNNYCFKDSDNSRNNLTGQQPSFDCKNNDASCLKDMEYPLTNTTLEEDSYYSISELLRPRFYATDNSYGSAGIQTYYDVAFLGEFGSPPLNPEEVYPVKRTITAEDFSDGAGIYRIRYFSKDNSQNHEPIQSINVRMLGPLSFSVEYVVDSAYISSQDGYENNLTAWVVWDPVGQEYLMCSGQLISVPAGGSFEGMGDKIELWPDTEWKYLNLEDGDYRFNVTCSDDHFQRLSVIENITIESDPTINSPYPKNKVYRAGHVKFGIQTQNPGTCYYTINPLNYEPPENPNSYPSGWNNYEWIEYEETGGVNHSSNISFILSGVRVIFSYCAFNDNTVFFGNYGDLIYFAIDELAPNLDYYDRTTGAPYNASGLPTDSLELGFLCNDTHIIYNNFNFNFGCDQLRLCNYTTTMCEPTTKPELVNNQGGHWKYIFRAPPPGSVSLKALLRVNDSGGNTQDFTINLPTLRNMSFYVPIIIICDPETGINCTNQSG